MLKLDGRRAARGRLGALLAAGLVLITITGCSGISPFGSDNSPLPLPPPLEAGPDGVVPDKTGRNGDDQDGEYPELADVPDGAEATKAAERSAEAQSQRENLAGELVADREQAKYTDEELRGGRVAAIAAPRPQPPAPAKESDVAKASPPAPQTPVAPVPPPPPAPAAPASAPIPAPGLTPAAAPPTVAPAPVPAATPSPPAPRSLPPQTTAAPVQNTPAYGSATFQPSRAQPLPADLVASLPPGVAQRYQETLRKPVPRIPAAVPVAPVLGAPLGTAYASIPFASGSSRLSDGDKRTVAQVANATRNGFGRIRVVGHASSSASSQSQSQRLIANWEISQARAAAVADELARQGVDTARIIIEAVGDSQAAYTSGYGDAEAAARRVDLFLE